VVGKLKAIALNNPDRRIFVRGDKDLPYGRIMEIMGIITQGGFTHVALLAEQTGPNTPPAAPPAAAKPARPKPG
jgi:biopolymer transport protein TolR